MRWVTAFTAVVCAAILCTMFLLFHRASISVSIAQGVLLVAWMLAPNAGIVAVAFLFRRWLIASVLVLTATTIVCGYATYAYCEYWWSNHCAALAGHPITDVVLPIEIVGVIFQWIGVASTAAIAFIISFAMSLASSWLQASRCGTPSSPDETLS
jgi:hypothetical protein